MLISVVSNLLPWMIAFLILPERLVVTHETQKSSAESLYRSHGLGLVSGDRTDTLLLKKYCDMTGPFLGQFSPVLIWNVRIILHILLCLSK
jgi:hypothetical protein